MTYVLENAKKFEFTMSTYLHFDPSSIKGWGTDFIIAGEFIHAILSYNTKKHTEYIDFYIFNEAGFTTLLDFYTNFYTKQHRYTIKNHYIEIETIEKEKYKLRLINAFGLNTIDIMNAMEIDILCCYYDGGEYISCFPKCEEAIVGRYISASNPKKCCISTILRAFEHGYMISNDICKALTIDVDNYIYKMSRMSLTYEDRRYLYMIEEEQRFQLQGIAVHSLAMAKSFLPYIYKHSIKDKIIAGTNINCGCFNPEFNICEVAAIIQEEKENTNAKEKIKENIYKFPPPPSRPVPKLPRYVFDI